MPQYATRYIEHGTTKAGRENTTASSFVHSNTDDDAAQRFGIEGVAWRQARSRAVRLEYVETVRIGSQYAA